MSFDFLSLLGHYLNLTSNQILNETPMPPMYELHEMFVCLSVHINIVAIFVLLKHCCESEREEASKNSFDKKCDATENSCIDSESLAMANVVKAVNFAAIAHHLQKRKATDLPYITHPIGVAKNLFDAGVYDPIVLQAAYLHDVVEDTPYRLEDIENEFGEAVMRIVAEVSDDKTLSKSQRKRNQISSAAKKSKAAKLVKLADKLHNLRDLQQNAPQNWSIARIQGYFLWALQTVDAMRGTNAYLESKLDKIFAEEFLFQGHFRLNCLPNLNEGKDALLEKYYDLCDEGK